MQGTKHVDPALCLYVGAHLLCVMDNKHLSDKVPRGNGTLCRVVSMKLKECAPSHKWKNYYGKKVWTVSADDVEWVECVLEAKTTSIVELEGSIKVLQDNMKTLDTTKKKRKEN